MWFEIICWSNVDVHGSCYLRCFNIGCSVSCSTNWGLKNNKWLDITIVFPLFSVNHLTSYLFFASSSIWQTTKQQTSMADTPTDQTITLLYKIGLMTSCFVSSAVSSWRIIEKVSDNKKSTHKLTIMGQLYTTCYISCCSAYIGDIF